MRVVAVTGATGHIGGLVSRRLAEAGVEQRLLVRDSTRAPQLSGSRVVTLSRYGDRSSALESLRGVDVLFMVSASESADRLQQHETFVTAAAEAGVQHLVYTSFLGAAPDATFTLARDHWATEQRVRSTGMRHTFLRDSIYLDFLPALAGEDGVIRGPAGEGRVGAVARADVARVAASVLLDPGAHRDSTYDLTGREALTLDEVARTITEVTGRGTTYHRETVEGAYASRASYNAPRWQVDAWVSTYTAIAKGELAEVNDTVESITGTAPITLREFLERSSPGPR